MKSTVMASNWQKTDFIGWQDNGNAAGVHGLFHKVGLLPSYEITMKITTKCYENYEMSPVSNHENYESPLGLVVS